jgi:hypothetical protein
LAAALCKRNAELPPPEVVAGRERLGAGTADRDAAHCIVGAELGAHRPSSAHIERVKA